jgi:hypothetical protein
MYLTHLVFLNLTFFNVYKRTDRDKEDGPSKDNEAGLKTDSM